MERNPRKGKSRKAKYLRFHKGLNQARRLMAAVIGTSMITTNIGSTTVWAAVPETKTENTNFVFDQTELGNALIDAANGNSVARDFNFVGEAAEDYAGLFELEDEKLYELKGLEQNKGDLTVKVYARLSADGFVMDEEDESEGEDDEYMITGDEQIIFLLLNSSAKQTGTIEVAGNTSQKIEILSAKELKKQMKLEEEELPAPDTADTTDPPETTTPDGDTTDTPDITTPDGDTTDTPETTTPDGETTNTTDTETPDGETANTTDTETPDGETTNTTDTKTPDGETGTEGTETENAGSVSENSANTSEKADSTSEKANSTSENAGEQAEAKVSRSAHFQMFLMAPAEEIPDNEAPAEETPDSETSVEETPDSEAPAEETPDSEAPVEETPDNEIPAESTETVAEPEETAVTLPEEKEEVTSEETVEETVEETTASLSGTVYESVLFKGRAAAAFVTTAGELLDLNYEVMTLDAGEAASKFKILTDDDYDFEYDLGGNPYSAFNWQIGSQWYYADKDKKKGLTEEDIKQIPDSLKPTIKENGFKLKKTVSATNTENEFNVHLDVTIPVSWKEVLELSSYYLKDDSGNSYALYVDEETAKDSENTDKIAKVTLDFGSHKKVERYVNDKTKIKGNYTLYYCSPIPGNAEWREIGKKKFDRILGNVSCDCDLSKIKDLAKDAGYSFSEDYIEPNATTDYINLMFEYNGQLLPNGDIPVVKSFTTVRWDIDKLYERDKNKVIEYTESDGSNTFLHRYHLVYQIELNPEYTFYNPDKKYDVTGVDAAYFNYVKNGIAGTHQYPNPEVKGGRGNLLISKSVDGKGTPTKETQFEFTVTKEGQPAEGLYSIVTEEPEIKNPGKKNAKLKLKGEVKAYKIPADGKITLKAGERAILTGLQTGTYTVKETKPSQSNCSATKVSVNGGVSAESLTANVEVTETSKGLARVDYENIYVGGDLTVSKTVDGTACDKDKFFNFKVELSDKTLNGTYGEMEFVGGEANFQLKHGESKKTSLPTGIEYKVTENPDGYTPNMAEVSGTIVENGDHKADFINTKNSDSEKPGEKPDGNEKPGNGGNTGNESGGSGSGSGSSGSGSGSSGGHSSSGRGHGGSSSSGKGPGSQTAEAEIPLPVLPNADLAPADEAGIPLQALPKTGDTTPVDVYMLFMTIGMMAAAYVLTTGKKKTEEE